MFLNLVCHALLLWLTHSSLLLLLTRLWTLCQIASPEGMKKVCDMFPKMTVITAKVDEGLNEVRSHLPSLLPCSSGP